MTAAIVLDLDIVRCWYKTGCDIDVGHILLKYVPCRHAWVAVRDQSASKMNGVTPDAHQTDCVRIGA